MGVPRSGFGIVSMVDKIDILISPSGSFVKK
jgi:hypothetical protein